jgi:hypothetical protein
VGEGALAGFDQGDDLLPCGVNALVQGVVDQPETAALGIFVLVLPAVGGQVCRHDQVHEQVEGVDAGRSPLAGADEVDVPPTAAARGVEEPADAEILAFLEPR